jgi:hypothetical protein
MSAPASLFESARKIALDRFRLLQPHLEEQRLLKAVTQDAGIAYRTALRWKMRYRTIKAIRLPELITLITSILLRRTRIRLLGRSVRDDVILFQCRIGARKPKNLGPITHRSERPTVSVLYFRSLRSVRSCYQTAQVV